MNYMSTNHHNVLIFTCNLHDNVSGTAIELLTDGTWIQCSGYLGKLCNLMKCVISMMCL